MAFPRIAAVAIIVLLIGGLALIGMALTGWIGPTFAHGTNVEHLGGKILKLEQGRDFLFQTDAGQSVQFQCRTQCRASLGHMQRHVSEKAHTDVYFLRGPDQTLLAVDVD